MSSFDELWDGPGQDPTKPQQPAPKGDLLDKLWQDKGSQPSGNALSRGLSMIGDAASQAFHHPLDAAASLVEAPVRSFVTMMSPGVGETRHDPRLSKGGNPSAAPIGGTYDAAHGGVTPQERTAAGLQTVANVAFPGVVKGVSAVASPVVGNTLERVAGLATAGGAAGAAYNPQDPAAGAIAGALTAPILDATTRVAKGVYGGMVNVGNRALDVAGRPATPTPVLSVAGKPLLTIASASDRAADLNARALGGDVAPDGMPANSPRPLAPMDVAGTPGVRLARTLKTTSPQAESIIRTALQGRADNAVNRVIQHGLETTGLATRENGVQMVDDMIKQRAANGNANYQPTFEKYADPLPDPEFQKIIETPAGQEAMKRGMKIAANEGQKMAFQTKTTPATFDPSTLNAQQQGLYDNLLKLNGGQVEPTLAALKALGENVPAPASQSSTQIAPTLKQAHYIKLGFDDILDGAPEPGSGGTGPNYARSVRGLRGRWLATMDAAAPEYADARQQYADESTLIKAGELGRELFKMHPDEAAKAFADLPADAQDVFRRAGFDALAQRVENGPADVERGVSKARDQQRIRLLFPDDQSFASFKQGLAEEGQMHANEQAALGGSNTADKLADLAGMTGVTLPDVMRAAATGRWHQLAGRVVANITRNAMSPSADALAAERARLLVAGASGDPTARATALSRMAPSPFAPPPTSSDFANIVRQAMTNYYGPRAFIPGQQPNGGTQP